MYWTKIALFIGLFMGLSPQLQAQNPPQNNNLTQIRDGEYYGTLLLRDGSMVKILIIDGDTLPVLDFEEIQITSKREFANRDERKRYSQWRKYAANVYQYAARFVYVYRQVQRETAEMRRGERHKYSKALEKAVTPEYEDKIRALSKSEGYILIKMVERELQMPFYDVIAGMEGKGAAFKWQTLGRLFGYNLKRGYDPNEDPLLESILSDLNISYGGTEQ